MPGITIALGAILTIMGLVAYFVLSGDAKSPTALIPAFFGVLFIGLGAVARMPSKKKLAMHIAVVLGVLGIAGTARGLMSLPTLLRDASALDRPTAVGVQSLMCVLCVVYVALCVRSFIQARRSA